MTKSSRKEYLGTDYITRTIAEKAGITLTAAKAAYRVLPEVFAEAIEQDIPINILGFCTICPVISNRKAIYNPGADKNELGICKPIKSSKGGVNLQIPLPPTKIIKVKMSNKLKIRLNPDKYMRDVHGRICVKPEILRKAVDEYYQSVKDA